MRRSTITPLYLPYCTPEEVIVSTPIFLLPCTNLSYYNFQWTNLHRFIVSSPFPFASLHSSLSFFSAFLFAVYDLHTVRGKGQERRHGPWPSTVAWIGLWLPPHAASLLPPPHPLPPRPPVSALHAHQPATPTVTAFPPILPPTPKSLLYHCFLDAYSPSKQQSMPRYRTSEE